MPKSKITKPVTAHVEDAEFPPSAIHAQSDRILNSAEFKATDAQRAFFQYVINKALAGQADEIKGYTVATEVFGRQDDFDQATDPIVSIQANKLRRALERYYLVAGRNDPIRIDIPKGTYVPVFHRTENVGFQRPIQPNEKLASSEANVWPTILVQSLENLTGNGELDYIGIGIATEIALEITRYQEIRVLRQSPEKGLRRATDIGARFVLCGSVNKDMTGLKVIVSLADAQTGIHIWMDAYQSDFNPSRLISFEERIAAAVVGKITSEDGVIVKTLSIESKRIPPLELSTHQAILRFYQFLMDFSPQTFMDSFAALRQACEKEPECGLAWSMLARLYSLNYSLELLDLKTPIDKAKIYAEKSVRLEPANQRVRTVMAFILLFENELSAGLAEVDRALQLNPNSLVFLENFGYLMTLFGDWQRGPALIRQTIEQNPYYNITVHYALWVDWVRQEKYDRAYDETLHFKRPLLFWEPLMKAAILGLLGRIEEGIQAGKDLLACKPDFPKRGRVLIRHYIKFDEIIAKVISGLGCVGIEVE